MLRRARGTIFWIGMNQEIKQLAENCEICMEMKPKNQKEPLLQHDDGNYPWEKIGLDLFEIEGRSYLLSVDYLSNFIEVDLLSTTTSKQVIEKLKKQFSRFGIPCRIVSDGGPQFTSVEFKQFTRKWGIHHHITSPHHPESNGKAESAVKIMKTMMMKCSKSATDQYEALLEQRNTPRKDTGLSPVEMMFGRHTRAMIPLKTVPKKVENNRRREARQASVKKSYDRRTRRLPNLRKNQPVYFRHKPGTPWKKGVVQTDDYPNYVVKSTDGAVYKRHRVHLRPTSVPIHVRDNSPPRDPVVNDSYDTPATPNIQPDPVQIGETPTAQRQLPPQTNIYSRPQRERKPPMYLEDYVRY
jgi:hypothetical protein